jgi:hypothetical protein
MVCIQCGIVDIEVLDIIIGYIHISVGVVLVEEHETFKAKPSVNQIP